MARKLKVSGDEKKIVISLDEIKRASFGFDADITAAELYEALDFSLNAQYKFVKGDVGDLPIDVFDAFCGMIEEIVKGVNGLAEPGVAILSSSANETRQSAGSEDGGESGTANDVDDVLKEEVR